MNNTIDLQVAAGLFNSLTKLRERLKDAAIDDELKLVDNILLTHKSTFASQPAEIKAPMPKCPHCGADPLKGIVLASQFPPNYIVRLICCIFCRNLLNGQIIGQVQDHNPGSVAVPQSGLWVPGMPKP